MSDDYVDWNAPQYQRKLNRGEISALKIGIDVVLRKVEMDDMLSYHYISNEVHWPIFAPHPGRRYLDQVRRALEHEQIWFRCVSEPYGLQRVSGAQVVGESPERVKIVARTAENSAERLALVPNDLLNHDEVVVRDTSRVLFSMMARAGSNAEVVRSVKKEVSANTASDIDVVGMLKKLGA